MFSVLEVYSSSHVHPAAFGMAEVEPEVEHTMIMQIIGGLIRHGARVYREIVDYFNIGNDEAREALCGAEEYSKYRFELKPKNSI